MCRGRSRLALSSIRLWSECSIERKVSLKALEAFGVYELDWLRRRTTLLVRLPWSAMKSESPDSFVSFPIGLEKEFDGKFDGCAC